MKLNIVDGIKLLRPSAMKILDINFIVQRMEYVLSSGSASDFCSRIPGLILICGYVCYYSIVIFAIPSKRTPVDGNIL
jgi:hypothetical protein